jgi:ATP-dependent DNA ligase
MGAIARADQLLDSTLLRHVSIYSPMLLRPRTLAAGFIAPCLPTKTDKLPSGSQWLHEIKHDGFRIIARKAGAQVRLYSRPRNGGEASEDLS